MEHNLRPVNLIRAELASARDLLSALGLAGGTAYALALLRVVRLTEELCAAEDEFERMAEAVALKWIYRYTGGRLLAIDEGNAPKGA
ncbi:hypothetical protein [Variovorax sp. dw_308]|uniref:hypothetical protein n=1 Tax=Variovorax sp. dw_308 TaxID=2721546 RepID=UPI001C45F0E2|nr:hypothetical protein [Variovorax sp. dw_308]